MLNKNGEKKLLFLLTFVLTGVTSWTIDLPEVRKYYFQKYSQEKEKELKPQHYAYAHEGLNNLYDGNYNSENYANDYEHTGSYMEKKVNNIIHKGSLFLEGLRRSIEEYSERLEQCDKWNFTRSDNQQPWRPKLELSIPGNEIDSKQLEDMRLSCERATQSSEHVRRLAELAVITTRELQDIEYEEKYDKHIGREKEMEQRILLTRLAYFLDELAHYTGFEPDAEKEATTTIKPVLTTLPTPPASMINASQEMTRAMMECLNNASDSRIATDRCRYSLPLPPEIKALFKIRDEAPPENPATQETSNIEIVADVKSIKKRSIDSPNPLRTVLNYYIKHKVWENSNPPSNIEDYEEIPNKAEQYDVENNLENKRIHKRSYPEKKGIHLHIPIIPLHEIAGHLKHKAIKIKEGIEKIQIGIAAKMYAKHLEKTLHPPPPEPYLPDVYHHHVYKRSPSYQKSAFYQNLQRPVISDDPTQDLSYYVKNKQGTNYNFDVAQALLVRAGLEQVFQTGNILVIQRYGSNFNPANPAPLVNGIIQSTADV